MMEMVNSILLVSQVILSISLIVLILLQHGKGADAGAAFGSGASATVFGARGSGNFLSKTTGIIAALFFLVCMGLGYIASHTEAPDGITGSVISGDTGSETMMLSDDLPPVDGSVSGQESDLPPAE